MAMKTAAMVRMSEAVCPCGKLLARNLAGSVEIRCTRCKKDVTFADGKVTARAIVDRSAALSG